jgi:hypothetical protein
VGEKARPDLCAVLEQTAWVRYQLWAGPVQACVAKGLRRALDATLKPLDAAEETDLRK